MERWSRKNLSRFERDRWAFSETIIIYGGKSYQLPCQPQGRARQLNLNKGIEMLEFG